jgi:hypothetical protein
MKLIKKNLIIAFSIIGLAIVNLILVANSSSGSSILHLKGIVKVAQAGSEGDYPCPDCRWEDMDVETVTFSSNCTYICYTSSGIYQGSGSCQVYGTKYIATCYGTGTQYCINGVMMTTSTTTCPTSSSCEVNC